MDASVLVATVREEPATPHVQERLARAAPAMQLLVPRLTKLEVMNALLRHEREHRRRPDPTLLERAVEQALRLTIEVGDPPRVPELASKHRLSSYDAVYLALTLDSGPGARLWTLDEVLTKAALAEGVLVSEEDLA